MITKNLRKELEELGFKYSEGTSLEKHHAYAVYNEYLISVYETAGKRTAFINCKSNNDEQNSHIADTITSENPELPILSIDFSLNGISVVANGDIPSFVKILDVVTTALSNNSIKGVENCSKCGNKFGSRKPKKVTEGNRNYIMCEHCAIETIEEISNKNQAKDKELNAQKTIYGILGSIACSLIGAFLYFALYYWVSPNLNSNGENIGTGFHYIFCATGTLVALLSYIGYRLFCKKISATAYITISATSLIFTAIGQYIGTVFEYIATNINTITNGSAKLSYIIGNKHIWLIHLRNTTPEEITHLYVDHATAFYKMLVISLMFAAVGAAIFLLTLRDKAMEKKEIATVETLSV